MSQDEDIIREIGNLYEWLNQTLASHEAQAGQCFACGKCCDFDAYGHRLYVTRAEMLYFAAKIGPENLKAMHSGQCPYRVNDQCSVHEHRFSGCRTFCCRGDSDFQNQLTEQALDRIKALSDSLDISYEYMDLRQALNQSMSP
jgi:hypothetical protein